MTHAKVLLMAEHKNIQDCKTKCYLVHLFGILKIYLNCILQNICIKLQSSAFIKKTKKNITGNFRNKQN